MTFVKSFILLSTVLMMSGGVHYVLKGNFLPDPVQVIKKYQSIGVDFDVINYLETVFGAGAVINQTSDQIFETKWSSISQDQVFSNIDRAQSTTDIKLYKFNVMRGSRENTYDLKIIFVSNDKSL